MIRIDEQPFPRNRLVVLFYSQKLQAHWARQPNSPSSLHYNTDALPLRNCVGKMVQAFNSAGVKWNRCIMVQV